MKKLFLFVAALVAGQPALATTYKWVDEHGNTQYGDTIPPQYVKRGSEELNKKGVVIKKIEGAMSEEQIKAKAEADAKKKTEERQALEQKRRDRALLATYTSEKEIDLIRDRNLQPFDQQIKEMEGELQRAKGAGIKHFQDEIAKKKREREAVRLRYEADKQRYRELTGKTP